MLSTQNLIEQLMRFNNTIFINSILAALGGTIAGVAVIYVVLHILSKKHKMIQEKQHTICHIGIGFVVMAGIIFLLGANWERLNRQINLHTDQEEMAVISSVGKVGSLFPYEKGGVGVIINEQEFYLSPQIGSMKVGMKFSYKYLMHSKLILEFDVLDDAPIPNSSVVTQDILWRFGQSDYFPIENISVLNDSQIYQYVENYYKSLGADEYNNFRDLGWEIYKYYNSDTDSYRCNIESLLGKTKVFIILDAKTGIPLNFWNSVQS